MHFYEVSKIAFFRKTGHMKWKFSTSSKHTLKISKPAQGKDVFIQIIYKNGDLKPGYEMIIN